MLQENGFWKEILISRYDGWRNLRSHVNKDSLWWRDLRKFWNLEDWGNIF